MGSFHVYLYGPNSGPIDSSFEESEARLVRMPKLHFEPDGSFVWVGQSGAQKIYGMIYDAGGKIRYCDLQGHCSRATWNQLCVAIAGSSEASLSVLTLPDGQLQDLQSFENQWWPGG